MTSRPNDEIAKRLVTIQRATIAGIEQSKKAVREANQQVDLLLKSLIEIIDLFDGLTIDESSEPSRYLRKAHRRLMTLLETFEVKEIKVDRDNLKPGFVRVLESRGSSNVQVCRRGYERGGKVLRPAEVMT